MKCLHCDRETEAPLCQDCRSEEILDLVYREVMYATPEECTLPQVAELKHWQVEPKGERDILLQIFELFDFSAAEYYICQYYKVIKDPRYEKFAVAYLTSHDWQEEKTQRILYGLINFYLPNDFISPMKWCVRVEARDDLACDLYTSTAHYCGMIGEYDRAEVLIKQAQSLNIKGRGWLYQQEETILSHFEKAEREIQGWRKKAYWPKTEERRRAIAMFYDEKGISYPRIETWPQKIAESDFKCLSEYCGANPASYCAFWCATGFSVVAAKCIYQIAGVKVEKGEITDRFQSYIRPWDGCSARKAAAQEAGVPVETLECAEDVDLIMKRFFEFVGDDVLISTDALGEQAKLISRAARYAGMAEIKNRFLDLVDLAEDMLSDFDFTKSSREYLLGRFGIADGKDALTKAEANHKLYQKMKTMGG